MTIQILQRNFSSLISSQLVTYGIHPLLAKLYASRGIASAEDVDCSLAALLPIDLLKNAPQMALRLADAIRDKEKILVVADYDADGATACALALSGLSEMGAIVDFIVPNRFDYGYGLSVDIVELSTSKQPDIILTVDNGIASIAGVRRARELGIDVLITDHHLPGDNLPDALIVNPNQPDCLFPSKSLAGVGVIFYVVMALRMELRQRGHFTQEHSEPNLARLLDLVALGTVADLVKLDKNNRILVEHGLRRMRSGALRVGIKALFAMAGRDMRKASVFDLGFAIGSRLNAAGRMDDMSIGINCLVSSSESEAYILAQTLEKFNQQRRATEQSMQLSALDSLDLSDVEQRYSLVLYKKDWHQGVVGLLASRLKERVHRPCIVFAQAKNGELRGSGRSIVGFHLRDALDLLSKRYPELILRFGGHAMASGLTISAKCFDKFSLEFENIARELLDESALERFIETDGSLSVEDISLDSAQIIATQVWGQGFAPPLFSDVFSVLSQRIVGAKHLKLILAKEHRRFPAMLFNQTIFLPKTINAVYQLVANEWKGDNELQLYIDCWRELDS